MSNGADQSNSEAECNHTNPMDSCDNNLMDRRMDRMAGRTTTINNDNNDSKLTTTCNSSISEVAYNNNLAKIRHSSNNNKLMVACDHNKLSATYNNNPGNIIHSSSSSYSSHNKGG